MEKPEEIGINVHLDVEVTSVSQTSDGYRVEASSNGQVLSLDGGIAHSMVPVASPTSMT
ncbi:MAG: hypothetical protein U5K69_28290 [Balneolaceae bacterium]|nr:hypothetical protein [Balneolaceae bacterium]